MHFTWFILSLQAKNKNSNTIRNTEMKNLLLSMILFGVTLLSAHAQKSLPTIAITTTTPLNAQEKVAAHMKTEGYDGPIGIKLRGNSSLGFNQKKYTLETRDADGKELDVSLLGLPAHSKWVLLAPYNDISMSRSPMSHITPKLESQRVTRH